MRNQPGLIGSRVDGGLLDALRRLFMALDENSRSADGERILPRKTRHFVEVSPADEAAVHRVDTWLSRIEEGGR